ncbi:MAG: murein L,D-transpeptidase family protein [Blastocatellia bacterium]
MSTNAGLLALPDDSRVGEYRILVKKAARQLLLYRRMGGAETLLKTYPVALGPSPLGTRKQQGDGATPEGDYYITHRNPRSNYHLSLGISYPGIPDADAGLRAGLITKQQHQAITSAIHAQTKPPQNTALGGDIFIHGGGVGRDWTLGCVALENDFIRELFETIPLKTKVRIEP